MREEGGGGSVEKGGRREKDGGEKRRGGRSREEGCRRLPLAHPLIMFSHSHHLLALTSLSRVLIVCRTPVACQTLIARSRTLTSHSSKIQNSDD